MSPHVHTHPFYRVKDLDLKRLKAESVLQLKLYVTFSFLNLSMAESPSINDKYLLVNTISVDILEKQFMHMPIY